MVARESPSYYYAYLSATLLDTQQRGDLLLNYCLKVAISLDIKRDLRNVSMRFWCNIGKWVITLLTFPVFNFMLRNPSIACWPISVLLASMTMKHPSLEKSYDCVYTFT